MYKKTHYRDLDWQIWVIFFFVVEELYLLWNGVPYYKTLNPPTVCQMLGDGVRRMWSAICLFCCSVSSQGVTSGDFLSSPHVVLKQQGWDATQKFPGLIYLLIVFSQCEMSHFQRAMKILGSESSSLPYPKKLYPKLEKLLSRTYLNEVYWINASRLFLWKILFSFLLHWWVCILIYISQSGIF